MRTDCKKNIIKDLGLELSKLLKSKNIDNKIYNTTTSSIQLKILNANLSSDKNSYATVSYKSSKDYFSLNLKRVNDLSIRKTIIDIWKEHFKLPYSPSPLIYIVDDFIKSVKKENIDLITSNINKNDIYLNSNDEKIKLVISYRSSSDQFRLRITKKDSFEIETLRKIWSRKRYSKDGSLNFILKKKIKENQKLLKTKIADVSNEFSNVLNKENIKNKVLNIKTKQSNIEIYPGNTGFDNLKINLIYLSSIDSFKIVFKNSNIQNSYIEAKIIKLWSRYIKKQPLDGYYIYTDGSYTGKTKYGFIVLKNGFIIDSNFKVFENPIYSDSNSTEVYAIKKALLWCIDNNITNTIHICSDSKNALDMLKEKRLPINNSEQIKEVLNLLKQIPCKKIIWKKVKGHADSYWHNRVDKELQKI
ncbi:MAG: ribonuclease HI [archaeon]